jgi:hypothetical protein
MNIRPRALIIGFFLAIGICALTPFNNAYRQAAPLGGGHFPLAPFYILIWMTALCALWNRRFKTHPLFTGPELMTVWALMLVISGIAWTGLARTFFINLTAPIHFASVENRWKEVLWPVMHPDLYPHDEQAVLDLYSGLRGGRQMGWGEVFQHIPWRAWFLPLAYWGIFILLCYWVMICMVALISRQALTNERMNFPLMRVPELLGEMLDPTPSKAFFGNRFLLAGMAIPVFLHLLNGLNFYYPSVPQLPTLILSGSYFPKVGLFSGFTKLKIYIYPAFIGFAFLSSKQISLSFWVFFILGGLLFGLLGILGYQIPAAALGITFGPTLAQPEETQIIGAFVVFFLFLFWLARHHFWGVVRQALFIDEKSSSGSDWFSSRFSVWGVALGFLAVTLWLTYFGMPLFTAVVVLGAFFMFTLVATRVICQGGVAYFTLTAAPLDGIFAMTGPHFFTHAGLLLAAVSQKVLFLDLRECLMPSLLHARKMTHKFHSKGRVLAAFLVTLAAGLVVSLAAMLLLCYKFGIRELSLDWATQTSLTVYDNIYQLLQNPVAPGHWVTVFVVVGAVVMLVLVICYHRFYWWPLHPIGYLTTYSSAMRILWFSFFIGWLCNVLCMRYGGVVLFKKVRYFFIGLIIGDFLMGGTWALIGLFSDASYQVLPT